jgi:hypothetical protein
MIAPQFQVPLIQKHQAHDNFDGSWFLGLRVGHPESADGTIIFESTPFFGNAFRSAAAIPDNTATHVAITYDDDTNRYAVYFNGILDVSGTAEIDIANNSRPVRFGLGEGGINLYAGNLDEIRFWNEVRSPDQILSSFNRTLAGTEPGLVGYWNFDTGNGDDSTSNGNDGSLFGEASIAADTCRRPAIVVAIDVKPGSAGTINLKSQGVVPVAILSTAEFDARDVDPASVRFGPNAAVETHGAGHIEDVNGDRRPDLMLHFRIQETGLACGQATARLTGQTTGGIPLEGSDSVNVVGCHP